MKYWRDRIGKRISIVAGFLSIDANLESVFGESLRLVECVVHDNESSETLKLSRINIHTDSIDLP